MPLMPKRVKFRKTQRGNRGGNAQRGNTVSFGDFGLQCLGRGWMTNRQIEACRVAINRKLKRKGKVWIRVFPHKSVTGRPPETRMGKGKGAVEAWVAVIRPWANDCHPSLDSTLTFTHTSFWWTACD